jgi:hypothetical protein
MDRHDDSRRVAPRGDATRRDGRDQGDRDVRARPDARRHDPDPGRADTRRWGYDPAEDISARGLAQDERQFGGDRGWGGHGGDRRAFADDPDAPRAAPPRRGTVETGAPRDRMPSHARDGGHEAAAGPGGRPGSAGRSYEARSERGRQGEWLAGDPGDLPDRDGDDSGDDASAGGEGGYGGPTGLGGMGSVGAWGGGSADRSGRSAITRRGGWGGYGGGTDDDRGGLGDMGGLGGTGGTGDDRGGDPVDGPRGDPDREGRQARRESPAGSEPNRYGRDDRHRSSRDTRRGPGRDDDIRHGPGHDIRHGRGHDTRAEPGRDAHLASGSGGSGDWEASSYGSGQRRGPWTARQASGEPYRPDPSFGPDAWPGDRSPQQRFGQDRPGAPDGRSGGHDAGSRSEGRRGPKGWRRSDAALHDAVCERLARSHDLEVADVSVEIRDGHVTLEGTVADRPMKRAIEDRIAGCAGVSDVDNRLKVMRPGAAPGDAPPRPIASQPQDSPTARDEARGHHSEPMPGGSGKNG